MKVVGGQCRGDKSGRALGPSGCNCPLGEASFPWGWWVRGGPLVLSLGRTQAPALTEFTLKSYSPGAAPQPLQAALISCSPHLYSSLPCPCRGVCVCVCVCVCAQVWGGSLSHCYGDHEAVWFTLVYTETQNL